MNVWLRLNDALWIKKRGKYENQMTRLCSSGRFQGLFKHVEMKRWDLNEARKLQTVVDLVHSYWQLFVSSKAAKRSYSNARIKTVLVKHLLIEIL